MKLSLAHLLFVTFAAIASQCPQAADECPVDDPSLSGTTWSGNDISGKSIVLNFVDDGTLSYTVENSTKSDATWKQEDDSIYFELGNGFVEYRGSIRGVEMTGWASTKLGYEGAWSAKRQSNDEDGIDSDWPEGSAMHTGEVASRAFAKAEKALNSSYCLILKELPPDEPDHYPRRLFVAAQRAWIAHREATCDFSAELSRAARQWKSTYSVACEVKVTQERIKELQNVLACIKSDVEQCDY